MTDELEPAERTAYWRTQAEAFIDEYLRDDLITAVVDADPETENAVLRVGVADDEDVVSVVSSFCRAGFDATVDDERDDVVAIREKMVRLEADYVPWRDRADALEELQTLPDVGPKKANSLYERGFRSIEDVARTHAANLLDSDLIGDKTAARIWNDARERTGESDQ